MKIKKVLLAFLATALVTTTVLGQESHGGQPLSFTKLTELGKAPASVTMPVVDVAALMAEDEAVTDKAQPYRFGHNHYVNLTMQNSGEWVTLKNKTRVWRLGIVCPDAITINIALSKFNIPEGAKLFLYNKDRSYVLGSFTSANMQADGQLGIDVLPGSEIIVEYSEPANAAFKGEIAIFRVTHGYRDIFKIAKDIAGSGNCHNNVICPIGDPWDDQIRSVAIIIVNGSASCTGALVNNTQNDGTPYFLTANHCGTNGVGTWVFRFNFNSTQCNTDVNPSGNQSVSGSVLRATYAPSDMTLLQLNSTPPASYNVYYSGWSNSNVPPTSGVGIHHPSGDLKKISFADNPMDSTTWTGNGARTHWLVRWTDGVTEGGSSGSPIYDQNKRIVGQLHGGPSFCGAQPSSLNDDYGKFHYSWNKGSSAAARLRDWLDPQNTGVISIDGYDPNAPTGGNDIQAVSIIGLPDNNTCISSFSPSLIVKNVGGNTIFNFTYVTDLNGNVSSTQTVNGLSLPFNNFDTIPLGTFNLTSGPQNFTATITSLNGAPDPTVNNTATANFTVANGVNLTLRVITDEYGEEFGAAYIAGNDTIILVNPGDLASNDTTDIPFCVPDGCYDFAAFDIEGDGICCEFGQGSYQILNPNGLVILAGGEFGQIDFRNFCTDDTTKNDILAVSVISPYQQVCTNGKNLSIIIQNVGTTTITSLPINYTVGGNANTFTYTGNLLPGSSAAVQLTTNLTLVQGANPIQISLGNPNGNADTDNSNNNLTYSVNLINNGYIVTLDLTTDQYGEEITWELQNQQGSQVLISGPGVEYDDETNYTEELCLPNGCYRFVIFDSAEDGICCQYGDGSFGLTGPNNVTLGGGGQYTDQQVVPFCLSVSVDENVAPEFELYPNPANDKLFVAGLKGEHTITLLNAQGQLVATYNSNALVTQLSTTTLANGLYMVRIVGANGIPAVKRLVINR